MTEQIKDDDLMYTNKHIEAIGGWGWHVLLLILILGWIATFILMVIKDEFSLWPLAFLIGAVFVGDRIGRQLRKNGYQTKAERKVLPNGKEEDRKDA